MSYPRHEYFRRVLCNLIGRDVENGELPGDDALIGSMIRNICYANAERYMALPGQITPKARRKGKELASA
jgi:glucuronate isomerase